MEQKARNNDNLPTPEELAGWLRQVCPGQEGEFVRAMGWLYENPDLAAFLAGGDAGPQRGELMRRLREAGKPEYMALASYRLWREKKNDKGENER